MLKRLELAGFKSFADKTVFEFPNGITAIVGPNGSGKSNIVDGVRWILGEQSAKSLRGGEMADVIFNGSTSRRSLGLAEVTMVFDNAKHQLPHDSEEVQITRRVYRTGEGEYLINGQIRRLKDIKELFLGSGAGTDTMCIIAQGKVESLLQASTKDRRAIFEEAAGISRFKAKKIETLRKLERVDQNLQRVKDIVEEVDKQLRTVKSQAAKAVKFRELSASLKELRVELGLFEYRQYVEKLEQEKQVLEQLKGELDQRAARAVACETEAERLEIFLADLEDSLREHEASLGRVLQQIKAEETTAAYEQQQQAELEIELAATRRRLLALDAHVGELTEAVARAEQDRAVAEVEASAQRSQVEASQTALQNLVAAFTENQTHLAQQKSDHLDQMQKAAHWHNEAITQETLTANLKREFDRLQTRYDQTTDQVAGIDTELHTLQRAELDLTNQLQEARQKLIDHRQEHDRLRLLEQQVAHHLSELRQERRGTLSRIEMLENLIESHEGLSAGVREVLHRIENDAAWSSVLGILADFLTVKRDHAPLIDLALGDSAQRFLVRDSSSVMQALASLEKPFSGRVSFMPIPRSALETDDATRAILQRHQELQMSLLSQVKRQRGQRNANQPGLVAPAEQLVSCDHPELIHLPAHLFGRTLIVRDLETAYGLTNTLTGFRFITLQSELLEADGTLTLGSHATGLGILSRKSELADLRELQQSLESQLVDIERDGKELQDCMEELARKADVLREDVESIARHLAEMHGQVERQEDRRASLTQEQHLLQAEMNRLSEELTKRQQAHREAVAKSEEAESRSRSLQSELHDADARVRDFEQARQAANEILTQAKVAFAQCEERLRSLRDRHHQAERELDQRRQEYSQGKANVQHLLARLQECQQSSLRVSAVLAQAYLDKEVSQRQVVEMDRQREQKRADRARLVQQAQTVRGEWHAHQENVHHRDLEVNNLQHLRDTLMQRLLEDYQINLVEEAARERPLPEGENPAPFDAAAAQVEVEDLRKKIARLGSVNMESLDELQELEKRSESLGGQYHDLIDAKKSLEEIISKINEDSRRLFLESFTVVRGHFQELFRKVFGGGMADIVLEDENDVLECGIEINARPPGKELRSILLLSGGEKTMTAVALLLAIFRSKPAPFCLLDEVDAALDEANIDRFTTVLREFMEYSQFIIVTHSKRTMAAADVIYGITMQESGISKQVAVRFEDWIDEKKAIGAMAS